MNNRRRRLTAQTNKSSCYLGNHEVCQFYESGKARVVFDCSAEFCGTLGNRQLLPVPAK